MKKIALFCFAVTFLFTNESFAQEESESDGINWISFEEALEASKTEPKMWFIDIYTDWCGWCKRMDASTFQDSLIIEEINANYYAVKLDGECKDDIVVGDRTYSFIASGRRGYNELPAELMGGKMSYPTYVFLNEDLGVLTAVPGYKGREDMLPIIEFCTDYDSNNPVDYQSYMETYESRYPQEVEEEEAEETDSED
ncbi:MAG: thioredoxin fold domain-containing protein [Crocinitomicaceae bacterium]